MRCAETLEKCLSWWNCPQRGCREDAKAYYVDNKAERARGYPSLRAYEIEYDSMGEPITNRLPKRKTK